jgi:hypothetical protein
MLPIALYSKEACLLRSLQEDLSSSDQNDYNIYKGNEGRYHRSFQNYLQIIRLCCRSSNIRHLHIQAVDSYRALQPRYGGVAWQKKAAPCDAPSTRTPVKSREV